MTVAGTTSTLRVTGVPSGYPSEQENNVKVRWVDTALEVMSDFEVPLLKAVGGASQFTADNTKIEWVLYDTWSDRGTSSGTLAVAGTTLTWDASIAHRFPRGSVLKIEDELVWVSAQASATTSTIVRDYAGTTDAEHASGTTVRVVGFTEVEGTSVVLRGSALRSVPYNHFSIYKTGHSESWAQTEANVYTRSGATMPEMMADTISQMFVMIEAQVIEGQRVVGSGTTDPPMSGGLRYFGTSANGATIVNAGGAKLSRTIMNTGFDGSFDAVGAAKMGRTVLCGVAAQRVLWEEYVQNTIRTGPNDESANEGFRTLMNEYGSFSFLGPYKRIPTNELWIINPALIEVGTYGQLGRLHEFDIATDGDFNTKGLYGQYGNKIKGIPGIVRIHNFTTS
jgi:hypothetical protein